MQIFRYFGLLVMAGVVWVIGGLLWSLMSPVSGRLEAYAGSRIRRECGWQSNCKLKAGDLFQGKWDTLYIFGTGVTQKEIDAVLGSGHVRAEEMERLIVLARDHQIVRADHSGAPVDKPRDGEIEFEDGDYRAERILRFDHEQWLRVTGFPMQPSGRFYVLTPTDEH